MAKRNTQTNLTSKGSTQDAEIVQKILENQEKELQLKAQSIEIDRQKDGNQFEYAKFAVEKQFELEKYSMDHQLQKQKIAYVLTGTVSLMVAAVVAYAMKSGHVDVAMRILEIVATAVISSVGGYHIGKNKKSTPQQAPEQPKK